MDVGPALVFGLMWLVFSAIRKAGSKPPGPSGGTRRPSAPPTRAGSAAGRPSARPLPGAQSRPLPGAQPRPLPPVSGSDATQLEGLRLQDLLRDLGRTLDQASGPAGRPADRRLAPAEDVEELGSLEAVPEVRSLEGVPARQSRTVVDLDDEAERIAARRMADAEAHGRPLTKVDHEKFDARIRQEPADKSRTAAYTARQLRDAVVWREILGPPVSLRDEEH